MELIDQESAYEQPGLVSRKTFDLEILERETSEWTDWMNTHLPLAEIPSEETCILFAAKSLRLAERVRRISRHLPTSLRTRVIEASILYQCWKRQVEARRRNDRSTVHSALLPSMDALAIVQKHCSMAYTVECADGHQYRINLPAPGREIILATRVICMNFALEMGLSVPPASLIFLNRAIALNAGIRENCRRFCLSRDTFCPSGDRICCLGFREFEHVESAEDGRPRLPLSLKAFKDSVGRTVLDIWVLNWVSEIPTFRNLMGHADPIFCEFSHCLMDSNWERFANARIREQVPQTEFAARIRSHQQLEGWIRRIEKIDLKVTWEILARLPSFWFSSRRMLVAAVMAKLAERQGELREIIEHLIKKGFFPAIAKVPQREELPLSMTPDLGNVRTATRQFRLIRKWM